MQFSSLSETLRLKWHVETCMLYIVRLSSVVYPTHKLEVSENGKPTNILVQGGARNVIPFYNSIKIVTSQY